MNYTLYYINYMCMCTFHRRCFSHLPLCAHHTYIHVCGHNSKTNINRNNPNIKKIIPNKIPINRKSNINMTAGTRLSRSAWTGLCFCTLW